MFIRKLMYRLIRSALAVTVDAAAHAALPDSTKALYVADGAGFKLDVTGLPVPEDTTALKTALEKERKDRAAADKKLKDTAELYKDVDPAKYRELMAKLGDNEEAELIKAGKIDEVFTRRTAKQQADFDKRMAEAATARDGALEVAATFMDRVLDNHVRQAAAQAGIVASAVEDVLLRARNIFKLDDEGNPVQYDKDGETVIMGKDGKTAFHPTEWLESMKETAPHWFPASGSGSGSGAGKDGKGGKTLKRSAYDAMTPSEQHKAVAVDKLTLVD